MADKTIKTIFLLRGGTEADWLAADPVLSAREPSIATDTGVMKIGDGVTPWSELAAVNEQYVYEASTHYGFPSVGKVNAIYKASDEKMLYQWNETELAYEAISTGDGAAFDIEIIYGGGAN